MYILIAQSSHCVIRKCSVLPPSQKVSLGVLVLVVVFIVCFRRRFCFSKLHVAFGVVQYMVVGYQRSSSDPLGEKHCWQELRPRLATIVARNCALIREPRAAENVFLFRNH